MRCLYVIINNSHFSLQTNTQIYQTGTLLYQTDNSHTLIFFIIVAQIYKKITTMAMGLAIAGAVTSLLGTAASGIGSMLANRRQDEQLRNERLASEAFYNRQLAQDPTKRSENAAVLSQLDRKLKVLNENAEAKNTIMGATPEMSIAQRQTSADAYGDALTNLASLASQRADLLNKEKYQADARFNDIQRNIEASRMKNWENLANNATNLGKAAIAGASAKTPKEQTSHEVFNLNSGKYESADDLPTPTINFNAIPK